MALGNTYNQNNEKQQYHPTVYSPYKMTNAESVIDPSSLSFSFWNSTLKITIAPKKQLNNDEVAFDYDNAVAIYLNHTKARILYDEICKFQMDPEKYNSSGVPSGQGLITISNGSEFGYNSPCLVIRKIDESGATTSSYAYQFKTDYYYSIRNYNQSNGAFDKVTADYNNIEIEQLKTLLIEYYTAMCGAMAYSVIDQRKYEDSRVSGKLEQIASKLGVSFGKNNTANKGSYSSVFNNRQATNFTSETLDDIARQMDDED